MLRNCSALSQSFVFAADVQHGSESLEYSHLSIFLANARQAQCSRVSVLRQCCLKYQRVRPQLDFAAVFPIVAKTVSILLCGPITKLPWSADPAVLLATRGQASTAD